MIIINIAMVIILYECIHLHYLQRNLAKFLKDLMLLINYLIRKRAAAVSIILEILSLLGKTGCLSRTLL